MQTKKRALVTGATGQDGALMARLLVDKGYAVYGTTRGSEDADEHWRLKELGLSSLRLLRTGVDDLASAAAALRKARPDEVYNFAAQNYSETVWKDPLGTVVSNAMTVVYLLEAIRLSGKRIRLFQAASSEIYAPVSPYSASKLFAFNMVRVYRERYGIFACQGILHGHESEYRGEQFVTRKISKTVANIALGTEKELRLRNIDGRKEWGYAPEFVRKIFEIMQEDKPADYEIRSGEVHTVAEFASAAFDYAKVDFRKALKVDGLGFEEMVRRMVAADMERGKAHGR